jgi:hypothetical protein
MHLQRIFSGASVPKVRNIKLHMPAAATGATAPIAADADADAARATGPIGSFPGRHHQERHVLARPLPRHRLQHPRIRLLLRPRLSRRVRGQGEAVPDGQLHLVWGGQELQLVQELRLRAPVRRLLEGHRPQLPRVCRPAEVSTLHRVQQRSAQDCSARPTAPTALTTRTTTGADACRLLRGSGARL